jgi:glycosyltransferase involved in cell wall biosynthesis
LNGGRLAASKHVDLVIQTCSELKLPLKVVGSGKALPYLQSLAGTTVEFLGSVSDEELRDLYARAKALIYPAEDEDFGMVPIEAMAFGTPVIVHHSGGFLETVVEGKTGIFFEEFSSRALGEAIKKLDKTQWDAEALYRHAKRFSKERFKTEILALLENK